VTYQWWKFLHIAGAFAFLLAHGVSMAVALRLRRERDRERIAALLEISSTSISGMYGGLLILIAAGVVLGFTPGIPGSFWGQAWIWTAIGVLLATMILMYAVAMPYYRRIREAVTTKRGESYLISDEELSDALTSNRPWVVLVGGVVGLAVILWLMTLKGAPLL
jgi:Na+/melibiose symporter-like transporter